MILCFSGCGNALLHRAWGIERQFREFRTLTHREVVVRYNTKEEIEATGEWLMRINNADIAEELMYVPSQLSKLGVAPIDVVDRLDYLRESKTDPADDEYEFVEPKAHEEPEDEQEPEDEEAEEESESEEEMLEDRAWVPVEATPLTFDYDGYGAWEWAEPIEKMVEDSILAVFDLCPDLPDFNLLASESRPKQPRARGKRARSVARAKEVSEHQCRSNRIVVPLSSTTMESAG